MMAQKEENPWMVALGASSLFALIIILVFIFYLLA